MIFRVMFIIFLVDVMNLLFREKNWGKVVKLERLSEWLEGFLFLLLD